MKNLLTSLFLFLTLATSAQDIGGFYLSTGFDPKMAFIGSDNKDTTHGKGLNYYGRIGVRTSQHVEWSGAIEVFDKIGYRAISLQSSYVGHVMNRVDIVAGVETSIISRREVSDGGLNVKWQEYLPSVGINLEPRVYITRTVMIGWLFNYKTRPDIAINGRLSSYVQVYYKF